MIMAQEAMAHSPSKTVMPVRPIMLNGDANSEKTGLPHSESAAPDSCQK
jgi:hypothetical protein